MINEQTLTLYFYEDGLDETERQQLAQALRADRVLAARYAALKAELQALRVTPTPSAPEHLKHQWHDLIAREAQLERQRHAGPRQKRPWLGMSAGFVAVLALGIAIGVFVRDQPIDAGTELATTTSMANPDNRSSTSAAFERGLQVYLADRQVDLNNLDSRPSDEQSALLLKIIMQNRLFARAAENQQSPDIARLMRALEPILLQLAAEETTPQDADALRRQLTFELNAMLTKLQQPASKKAQTI